MAVAIDIWEGDITQLAVDAIVNAANEILLGGGGVDGAIHRAAGPALLEECRAFGGCPTGDARITGGHDLPARFVIHTVGPVWRGGSAGEAGLLASCYRAAVRLASDHVAKTLAFPAISTGVYGYPPQVAAQVAVSTLRAELPGSGIDRVTLVAFDAAAAATLRAALGEPREDSTW